jgi:hypothetical protein
MVDFTGSGLRITDYGLRITDCGLRIADYGLRIADYGLRIVNQIVYFFGKKPQELSVATCSYAMPPRKHHKHHILVHNTNTHKINNLVV